MTIITYLLSLLLTGVLTSWTGFHPTWHGRWTRPEHSVKHERHERHHGRTKVVVAANDDGQGSLKVRSRHGATHVTLGHGRHGLEVWTDEGGKTRVDLGDALKVETDEQGASQVRLGDLVVNSD